ncbi:MAG TPA: SRPBCC family protein [Ornithinibacter sp.]|nr:SRPBCC family protein [Ornithinibacter sp.]
MTGTIPRHGRTEAFAATTPDAVWEVIADVTRIGQWSGECRSARLARGASRPAPGIRFRGWNRSGPFLWTRSCLFTVVDPPRHLAWRTVGLWGHVDSTEWHITLETHGDGTRIVQSYDVIHVLPGVDRIYWRLITAHRDRSDALAQDVDRLAALAVVAARTGPRR